jgi:predicted metallopeptidase
VQATLTPLRFEGGSLTKTVRGRRFGIERIVDERGREMLYLLNFLLPRFLESPFEERLVTVLHELWHIGPAFDGDLRRFDGRCYAHSHSQAAYDEEMTKLARRWLADHPPVEDYAFLRLDLAELQVRGPIWGMRYPVPKLRPVQ